MQSSEYVKGYLEALDRVQQLIKKEDLFCCPDLLEDLDDEIVDMKLELVRNEMQKET
jgi:hypothetical protein